MSDIIFTKAKWICPKEFSNKKPHDVFFKESNPRTVELPEEYKNLHMLTKKIFKITEKADNYRIKITADDYYKLYINGKFVAKGPAQGYYFCYYWNEIDITDYLVCGDNEILVDVYYQGLINRAYNSGDMRMGLIAEIYSGKECIACTDKSWQYAISGAYTITHTFGYDTGFAENFDSRWVPQQWENATEKYTDYTFNDEPTKVLEVYPKSPVMKTLVDSGVLYDFGEETVACLKITAKGKSGDKVRILCGEELEDTPLKVRFDMRCNCLYDEFWTLSDGESELLQYDYKAFRYVALIPDEGVQILDVKAMVQHYPFDDDHCVLETENEVLKSVWDICKNGIKYGSQEVYVDCPQREKGQYAGDLTVSSASQVILSGDTTLFKKAIDNQMQSTKICKGLMAVTPGSMMQEIADYSLQFPILALRYYKLTGDKEYLKECYLVCDGIIEHFSKFATDNGLLGAVTDKWNLVDWPDNLRDNYDFPLTNPMKEDSGSHNVINAFYIGCVKDTEQIANIIGIKRQNKSKELTDAFYKEFYDEKTGLFTDSPDTEHSSLHSNVIPAFYGICRECEYDKIAEFIMEKGLCCGVYMAYFVLKALCRMGRYEDAYKLITNESEHSWYNMVREGATTCLEAWGKDQKWNTSLCHPWASAPISVLVEDILPNMPEIGRVIFKDALYSNIDS